MVFIRGLLGCCTVFPCVSLPGFCMVFACLLSLGMVVCLVLVWCLLAVCLVLVLCLLSSLLGFYLVFCGLVCLVWMWCLLAFCPVLVWCLLAGFAWFWHGGCLLSCFALVWYLLVFWIAMDRREGCIHWARYPEAGHLGRSVPFVRTHKSAHGGAPCPERAVTGTTSPQNLIF